MTKIGKQQGKIEALRRLPQLHWLGQARIVAYSRILVFVSVVYVCWCWHEAIGKTGSDFLAFWSAARLVVAGAASKVYNIHATFGVQAELGRDDVFAFVNPPPFLLVIWPLGYMSYAHAWIAWVVATYAVWFLATRSFAKELSWPIAAFPGAMIAAGHAQTGLLVSGLQAGAANMLRTRPLLAGGCIGALIFKPHLALLVPVALVAGKHWRAFAGATISAVGLILLAWLVFGTDTLLNYRQSWAVSRYLMDTSDVDFFLRQVTVYAAVRVALSFGAAVIAQAMATLITAVLTWKIWTMDRPLEGKIAFLMAATPLATPYLFSYDLPFLILPVCWLIGQARTHPGGAWERPLLLFFYLSPLVARALALPLGANLSPWVQVLMLWAVWRRIRDMPLQIPET